MKSIDEVSQILVELDPLLQPFSHLDVPRSSTAKSLDESSFLPFCLVPSILHLPTFLSVAEHLEVRADLRERCLLVVGGGGNASLVRSVLL